MKKQFLPFESYLSSFYCTFTLRQKIYGGKLKMKKHHTKVGGKLLCI